MYIVSTFIDSIVFSSLDLLELTVTYSGLPSEFPSSIYVFVDYGDGHYVKEKLVQSADNTTVYILNVTAPGIHVGFVELSNLASSVREPLMVSCNGVNVMSCLTSQAVL